MGALTMPYGSTHTESAPLLLGVDGGGTKTEVVIADAAGNELGRGFAGASNYQKIGFPAATAEVVSAEQLALQAAQGNASEIRSVVLGMSGVDREADARLFRAWAAERYPQAAVQVVNDAELVLHAGTPQGWGIGVICGTGATVVGRTRSGVQARADGWGHLLGDEGSGYWIGSHALRAVFRAIDGRGPQTALQDAIFAEWGIDSYEPILTRIYSEDAPASDTAALAAVVNRCAEAGDAVAQEILEAAGTKIADTVAAVIRRLGMTGVVPIGLAGGVIIKSRGVQRSMLAAARERDIDLSPVTNVPRPVLGAVKMAVGLLAQRA